MKVRRQEGEEKSEVRGELTEEGGGDRIRGEKGEGSGKVRMGE